MGTYRTYELYSEFFYHWYGNECADVRQSAFCGGFHRADTKLSAKNHRKNKERIALTGGIWYNMG